MNKRVVVAITIMMALLLMAAGAGVERSQAAQEPALTINMVHIFGGAQDSRSQIIEAMADDFFAQTNIRVNVTSTSTDYTELFNQAVQAAGQGNAPHIVQVEEGLTRLAADSGLFVPISDIATPEQLASLDDLLPTVRSYYQIGEVTWSVPWNASNPILYYNRGMFEAAGLDPDSPPRTFDEMLTACEAISAVQEELGIAACANWPMVSWFPEQWVAMQNGLVANNDNGRSAPATEMLYDSPEMLTVVNWWAEMARRGYYIYSGRPHDYNGEGITFLSKRTAMTINSTAGLTLFQTFSLAQGIDLGTARLPIPNETATNGVTVGGASLWVTAGHPEAELRAAADFIFFMTSTENDIRWHQGTGYFPTRISSVEQLEASGWFEQNPAFGIAIGQIRDSVGNIANAGAIVGPSTEARMALIQAIQSIVDNGEDVETALAAAKAAAVRVLADYNLLVGGN